MNCQQVSANLSSYFDGQLSPAEMNECRCHIESCPACHSELARFQSLSSMIRACDQPYAPAPAWSELCESLNNQASVSSNTTSSSTAPSPRQGGRSSRLLVLGLALAASLFVWLAFPRTDTPDSREIVIDYSRVVSVYAGQPTQALQELAKEYSGQDVDLHQAQQLLGYQPLSSIALPKDARLVSAKVLKLPECLCKQGKCTCAPGKCNCAALLCRRTDNSEFLVLEHGQSSKVQYGQAARQLISNDNRKIDVFGTDDQLAASWIHRNRRFTAFGLRSNAEVQALASAQ